MPACFIPCTPFTLRRAPTPLQSLHLRPPTLPHRPKPLLPRTLWKCSAPTTPPSSTPSLKRNLPSLLLPPLRTSLSLLLVLLLQAATQKLLTCFSFSFPAPLAAMLLLLTLLSTLRLVHTPTAERLVSVLSPAVRTLTRWLAVFFVPNLVMLPLAPMLPAADLPKIAVILIAGFFTTLFASAGVCIALRETMTLVTGQKPAQLSSIAGGGAPPSNRLITSLAIASALSFALVHMGVSYAMLSYGLFVTLLTFTIGQRFPPLLKRLVHPLITCTLGTQALLWLVSLTTHSTFAAVLATYYTRAAGAAWGGGNVLAYLLGPAVITFAYTMDARRRLAIARGVEVVFTSLFASFASLFGTAYVARLLRMSRTARLLVIPRTITAPLAVAIAEMLGADLGLAASVVALTGLIGANVAAGMLTVFKIKDPVVRGLSVGCSAHGLGTAAVSDEGGAFPFAALAMTLVGVFSTIFVAWAPGRAALLRVALGGVSTIAKM